MCVRHPERGTTELPAVSDENFHERSEHELCALSDEQLLAYIKRARDTGRIEAMTQAVRVLVWGYLRFIEFRVALKVPRHEADEEWFGEIIESALESAFDGVSKGEFHNWITRSSTAGSPTTIRKKRLDDQRRCPTGSDEAGAGTSPRLRTRGPWTCSGAIDAAIED